VFTKTVTPSKMRVRRALIWTTEPPAAQKVWSVTKLELVSTDDRPDRPNRPQARETGAGKISAPVYGNLSLAA
jgi:hypothetical protein